jgi:tRNA modification GTPase
MIINDTIAAPATAQGIGAIGIIRLSGKDAINICQSIFKGKDLTKQPSHTIHYGHIIENLSPHSSSTDVGDEVLSPLSIRRGANGEVLLPLSFGEGSGVRLIDEVMVSIFHAPKSFTTEDVVEISCHGSPFIQEQILQLLVRNGARLANPGEFTMRAFLNGRIDLSQAEAVADLIASNSEAAHDIAIKQIRGGFSNQIKDLRTELVDFAALLELELDFSEEDVEFANRSKLISLIEKIRKTLMPLIDSFKYGNVIKSGVPVAIIGKPNAGKSTLLNALLNEDRAIVSSIAGTTRDTIEEVLVIEGISFRIIDTAGLRETDDAIESIGISKALEKVQQAKILIYVFDANDEKPKEVHEAISKFLRSNLHIILCPTKIDLLHEKKWEHLIEQLNTSSSAIIGISAKEKINIDLLKHEMVRYVATLKDNAQNIVVANTRHHNALIQSDESLQKIIEGINQNITTDILAFELKNALDYLGEISGTVTNEEVLGSIFSKFCIGK